MTWFKENKFLAGLITITVLLAALIIFFGLKAGSSSAEVQKQGAAKEASVNKAKSLNPFPNPDNAKAKEESLKLVIVKANEAREMLLAFRPEKMENIPGKDFSANLTSTVDRVKSLYTLEKAIPSGFNLGFETYSGSLPREEATGVLSYQLGALEYLLTQLAESGVKKVVNLYREKLPAEAGEKWPGEPGAKRVVVKRKRPVPGVPAPPKFDTNTPSIAHRMPVELTFRAPEPAVREFLTRIANSEQYFFETRIVRILNPSPIPSAGKAASAPKPKSDFGDGPIVIEGDEPAEGEPVESVKILDKVSGGDELVVFLRADLLLFTEKETLPELK
jgi:hypothetical protein